MKIIKQVELVTFDMDGTLIDDEWAHERAKAEIARSIGAEGEFDLAYYTGRSNRLFWQHILDKFKLDADIEELIRLQFNKVLEYVIAEKQPESDGLTDAVRYLKSQGIKVAITSGSDEYFINSILDYLNLSSCFDVKISKDFVKNVKPAPDIYLAAQRVAGCKGAHSVGIEDSNSGCQSLHAAGMLCIGYMNKGKNPQSMQNADMKIDTMTELIDIIKP